MLLRLTVNFHSLGHSDRSVVPEPVHTHTRVVPGVGPPDGGDAHVGAVGLRGFTFVVVEPGHVSLRSVEVAVHLEPAALHHGDVLLLGVDHQLWRLHHHHVVGKSLPRVGAEQVVGQSSGLYRSAGLTSGDSRSTQRRPA